MESSSTLINWGTEILIVMTLFSALEMKSNGKKMLEMYSTSPIVTFILTTIINVRRAHTIVTATILLYFFLTYVFPHYT
jgi:hypothetical protein